MLPRTILEVRPSLISGDSNIKTFLLAAVLKRTLLDTMSLKVRAQDVEHAYEIAREFLMEYPEKTPYGNDIPFCVIENRETLTQEVTDIEGSDVRK